MANMRFVKFPVAVAAVIATGLVFSASAADPNTWWVDDDNYGAAVRDGSEEHPFGSIHEAITNEACVAGDTIKVKPGTYDKDYDERKGKVLEHYRNSYWYYYEFIKPINHKQQQL